VPSNAGDLNSSNCHHERREGSRGGKARWRASRYFGVPQRVLRVEKATTNEAGHPERVKDLGSKMRTRAIEIFGVPQDDIWWASIDFLDTSQDDNRITDRRWHWSSPLRLIKRGSNGALIFGLGNMCKSLDACRVGRCLPHSERQQALCDTACTGWRGNLLVLQS